MTSNHLTPAALARLIDHTLLKADATPADVLRHCDEARRYLFFAVCVNPVHVALVANALHGSGVKACSVVGFPLGATTSRDKALEAEHAIRNGAAEIDMVIQLGAVRDQRWDEVLADIAAVRAASAGKVLKVIIETCLLTDDEKRAACRVSAEAGADFVKTSTGFSSGGATVEDVMLMRAAVGDALGVKASGGVRSGEAARALIAAGANRIGASSGIALVTGAPAASQGY